MRGVPKAIGKRAGFDLISTVRCLCCRNGIPPVQHRMCTAFSFYRRFTASSRLPSQRLPGL